MQNNDGQCRSSDILCICQQCDGAIENVHSALLDKAALSRLATTHTAKEDPSTLEGFLQGHASNRECQGVAQTVRLPAYSITYDVDRVMNLQAPVGGALQYIAVALLACSPSLPSFHP